MKKFNKGEWSELYVFFSILADGKIYAADENLNRVEETFYSILKIIREHKNYSRDETSKLILIHSDNEILKIPIQNFIDMTPKLLNEIKTAKGSSFEIPEISDLLSKIGVTKVKAESSRKGDLTVQIHDDYTGFQPIIDFSIKSYLGGTPTLLNASSATIAEFLLSHDIDRDLVEQVNAISGGSKIKDRIEFLRTNGYELEFNRLIDQTFRHNLTMIDYKMPELLSLLFLCSYFVKGKKISDVVDYLCRHYYEFSDSGLVEYKVKDLLVAIALGMVPKTKWSGMDEANGGYVIVKKDGDIVCYHIYDRNRLKNYLYQNTKFDSPSSSRTGAGIVNVSDNQGSMKLTIQIQFT
ncbi:HpaII family restriction endonuclease [Pseudolactococcus yaeyamensis]